MNFYYEANENMESNMYEQLKIGLLLQDSVNLKKIVTRNFLKIWKAFGCDMIKEDYQFWIAIGNNIYVATKPV